MSATSTGTSGAVVTEPSGSALYGDVRNNSVPAGCDMDANEKEADRSETAGRQRRKAHPRLPGTRPRSGRVRRESTMAMDPGGNLPGRAHAVGPPPRVPRAAALLRRSTKRPARAADDQVLYSAAVFRDTPVPAPALPLKVCRVFHDLLVPHGVSPLLAYASAPGRPTAGRGAARDVQGVRRAGAVGLLDDRHAAVYGSVLLSGAILP